MINSHFILHIISLWFLLVSALHFSRFPSFLHSVPMCTPTTLESKDCLALLLCNSIAYLGLPEIIVSNVLFFKDLFPAGILYCFFIMDHWYYYHNSRQWSPGKFWSLLKVTNNVTACKIQDIPPALAPEGKYLKYCCVCKMFSRYTRAIYLQGKKKKS